MDIRIIQFLALAAFVQSRDVIVGQNTDGTKIFDEKKEASPALWRQVQNVTVNASDSEVISRVVITDLRPDKDGDAKIVEGGEGQKNVTVELKSPTVLRGYEFHIEVYAIPENNAGSIKSEDVPHPSLTGKDNADSSKNVDGPDHTNAPSIPASLSTSIDVTDETRKVRNANGKEITIEPQTSTHLPVTSEKDLKTNHAPSRHTRDTHKEEKTDESKIDSKNIPIPRFIPLIAGKQDTTTKTPETNDKPNNNQDKTTDLNGPSTLATTTKADQDAKQSTTEVSRNARDTAKEEKKDNATPTAIPAIVGHTKELNDRSTPLTTPKIDQDVKQSTTEKPRNARDTEKEDKKDNTKPAATPALVGQTKDLNGPSTPLTTPKIDQDVKQSTTGKPRHARDTTKEEKKDNTTPEALDNNGPKLNTNDHFAHLAPAIVGRTRDTIIPSTPATTTKADQDAKQTTTEKPRNARDTAKEENKDNTTPAALDSNGPKLKVGNWAPLAPALVGQTKDLNGPSTPLTTPKINQDDKQSTTVKPRNARDTTKEDKKDMTTPAAIPAIVGQTKDLNDRSTPLTTLKINQDAKQSTTEKPRHARDTIKEDKKDETTPKTPDSSTNEHLTPVVVGQTKDINVNDESSASTQKINTHDSKDGLAQHSDAAKTLGPYTVPISFKLQSSTEVPNGSSTTEKSGTVKQDKRDTESKHAEESKDDEDKLLAPKVPKAVPHDSTKKDDNGKPVISIQ